MGCSLPFRRVDVVDADLNVVLSGPTLQSLLPVSGRRLERDLEREVQRLRREAAPTRAASVVTGLLDLDYGVRLLRDPQRSGSHMLVALERLSIGERFRHLSARATFTDIETEAARLLAAGASEAVIAWRLGLAPIDAKSLMKRVLLKAKLADRGALARAVYGNGAVPRRMQTTRSA